LGHVVKITNHKSEIKNGDLLLIFTTGACTAVFWDLQNVSAALIKDVLHGMLDRGFEMRPGINVVQLHYHQNERFWQQGDQFEDATGARVVTAAPAWDGCIVAFSGPQRVELEFRFRGRDPYVLLHQPWESYQKQRITTPPAMTLLRLLLDLYGQLEAQCCAIPVAGNWLMDESWNSLLQQPYFPDLFIIPQSAMPSQVPPLFRATRLAKDRAILTTLPVKFAPGDDSIERTERELRLDQLRACKAIGEKAYDQMYDAHGSVTGLYSDAKEAFYDAIRLANELGLIEESRELQKRLEHIKAVFRSQFS
jgi:hypothetical protein